MSVNDFIRSDYDIDLDDFYDFVDLYQETKQPIAYLCNLEIFCGYEFYIDKRVLIPRVETEELVEHVYNYIINNYQKDSEISILDLCCGSGIIGISLYLKLQDKYRINLTMSDISSKALEVTKINLDKHNITNVNLVASDLLTNIDKNSYFDIIVTNPPYVPSTRTLDELVLVEPHLAIFSGEDGMDCYNQLFNQLQEFKNWNVLFGEYDPTQTDIMNSINNTTTFTSLDGQYRFLESYNENY